jgi:metal-responsive CopG/Arc/MetJ family transcriptional regulator
VNKKVIQVPLNPDMLEELDRLAEKQSTPRAEIIHQACRQFLKRAEQEELDSRYRKGYAQTPETPQLAEAQVELTKRVIAQEHW